MSCILPSTHMKGGEELAAARYRTHVASLLGEIMGKSGISGIAAIDKRRVADEIGISHQTFYEWYNADSDDPTTYLSGYRSETEWRFRLFFARMLDKDPEQIKVVERIVLDPMKQERASVSASALA